MTVVIKPEDKKLEEGTAAADTLKTHSSAACMGGVMSLMGKMSKSDQIDFFNKSMEKYSAAVDNQAKNLATNKSSINVKMPMGSLKEDIAPLFEGENLTEAAIEKFTTLFETALDARLAIEVARLEENNELELEKAYTEISTDLVDKVDDYLVSAIDEWMEENKIALETGTKIKMMETFFSKMHTAFVESYIDIPEDKVDLVAELESKIEELSTQVNEQTLAKIKLEKQISEQAKGEVIAAVSEGLTDTQKEKLSQLTESFKSDDVESFTKKTKLIKETYFKSTANKKPATIPGVDVLTEENVETPVVTGTMAHYAKHIDRLAK